jgi:WD40 repeat protein
LQGKPLADLNKHSGPILSALFSPDSRYILTASEDGTAKLWNLDGEIVTNLTHKGPVLSAAISPNNQWILTASEDKTAKLWDRQGRLLVNLDKHKAPVHSAVFSFDSRRILTASQDGTAKIWYTPEEIYKWLKTAKIPQIEFNHDPF